MTCARCSAEHERVAMFYACPQCGPIPLCLLCRDLHIAEIAAEQIDRRRT